MHKTINSYYKVLKLYPRIILLLGCSYGSLISFVVYGPVMQMVAGGLDLTLLSSLGLASAALGLLSYRSARRRQDNRAKNILNSLGLTAFILLLLYGFLPSPLQILAILLLGFTAGGVIACWTPAFAAVAAENRIKTICLGLFLAYGSKYISNILGLYVRSHFMTAVPALLILASLYFLNSAGFTIRNLNINLEEAKFKHSPLRHKELLFLVFLIYLTAGITYAGIFPQISSYAFQKFYNVIPFLTAVFFAGAYGDSMNRKYLLNLGLSFLGLSFAFYVAFSGVLSFFLIQTSSEISWAFLNIYIVVLLYDLAYEDKNMGFFISGLVFLMGGIIAGGALTTVSIRLLHINPSTYGAIAHIPLFVSIGLLSRIPEKQSKTSRSPILFQTESVNEELKELLSREFNLTRREIDVAVLLLGGYSNLWIARQLYISPNTAKYHTKNIFIKMKVNDRNEVLRIVADLLP
jgi:DNA-binding CsgD family transcriptional regulator